MKAALFTMRCFETAEREFPFFVTSFIVYGASELILPTAEHLFTGHQAGCGRPCGRVHKTGPLPIDSLLRPESTRHEIDWLQVIRRLEDERPHRKVDEGVCLFQDFRRGPVVKVELEGSTVRVEFDPAISAEMLEEERKASLLSVRNPSYDARFLFIGSLYEAGIVERIGTVLLIEAASLKEAADIYSATLDIPQKGCIHVEWCYPVHRAGL